ARPHRRSRSSRLEGRSTGRGHGAAGAGAVVQKARVASSGEQPRLVSPFVDSHAHLQEPEFAADRDAVIDRAQTAGVETIIVPAVDLETARVAHELALHHEGVFATAGYHPHEADGLTPAAFADVEAMLALPKVVAVGEIGLDFYRMLSPRETQLAAFEAQLE